MKNKLKYLSISVIFFLLMFTLVGCNKKENKEPKQEEGKYTLNVNVYDNNNKNIYQKTLKTDKTNLLEILEDKDDLRFITEDSEGGKFIVSILGIPYENNYYWYFYVNGEPYLENNISDYEIKNNDIIDFRFEKSE